MGIKVRFLEEADGGAPGHPTMPERAVVRDGESTYASVARDGEAERRTVKVGEPLGGLVPVLEGLDGGEAVIAKYLPLLTASLRRKRLRTFFIIASIVVAFLLFGLAESLRYALQSGVAVAGADRLLTMHKVSFTQLLPASYENRTRAIDGVVDVTPQTWFGAWFRDERNQIPAFPVKPEAFLACLRNT